MNYYEELAVAADASVEEIHQAFRVLARVLHPDNQQDPALKRASERQMIRLNEILATLSDPERRRKYDASMQAQLSVPDLAWPEVKGTHRLLPRYAPWALAASICLAAAVWYLGSNEAGEIPKAQPGATMRAAEPVRESGTRTNQKQSGRDRTSARTRQSQKPSPRRPDVRRARRPASTATVELTATTVEPVPALPGDTARIVEPPFPPPALEPASGFGAKLPRPSAPTFAGHWFYTRPAGDPRTPGLYPPEFIELFLSEEHGTLSGTYWARYRLADKAVSPEVRFRVKGAATKRDEPSAAPALQWASDDGAKGQLKLVLREPDSLEVIWWTSEMGQHTALTSGGALLVRQLALR